MIESGVFPKIEGVLPEGEHFWRHHDLASSHTSQNAKQFSGSRNIATLPRAPSGEDIWPLDIYVNPPLKHRLKEDLSTRENLMADVIMALGDMGPGPVFFRLHPAVSP